MFLSEDGSDVDLVHLGEQVRGLRPLEALTHNLPRSLRVSVYPFTLISLLLNSFIHVLIQIDDLHTELYVVMS